MYLSYINQLRAVASLLVVYVHCIHGLQWDSSHGNLETARLLKIITNYGTFLFVFIAGFLFQHLLYKYNYRDYLKSRFLLVVMPYLVISIPAILAWTFLFNKSGYGMPLGFYDEPWWYRIGFFYLSGQHMAPLWFIPMICIFYLLSPLFKLVDRFPWLYWSLPLLLLVSYYSPRSWDPSVTFVHFLSVYVLGMAASRYKDQVLEWSWRLRWVLFAGFIGIVCYEWFFLHSKQSFVTYMNKFCLTFMFLGIFTHCDNRPLRWLTWYASFNFGVFFLHTYANAGLKILFAGGPARSLPIEGNVFFQFCYFGVVVALSIVGVLIIKKLTGRYSKYTVGA